MCSWTMLLSFLVMEATAGLLVVVGVPLMRRQVAPNAWYGFRVPSTLRNEALWYEVNAAFGKDLVVFGAAFASIALVLSLFPLSPEAFALGCAAVLTLGVTGATVHGFVLIQRRRDAPSA